MIIPCVRHLFILAGGNDHPVSIEKRSQSEEWLRYLRLTLLRHLNESQKMNIHDP